MRRILLALAALGLGLGLAWLARPQAPAVGTLQAAAPPAPLRPPPLPVRFRSDTDATSSRARLALERVLATEVGHRARQLMESGALREPLTIELNHRGDQFTRYRVPGRELSETIVFDPDRLPMVETEAGSLRALPETVLAHELGHAVFKLISEEAVIHTVENPIRDALGLPRRRL